MSYVRISPESFEIMMKTIQDYNFANKKVLLRLDLNVPLTDDGELLDATRIIAVLPTIKFLLAEGAKIIVISHFGRPNGEYNEALSLKRIVPFLEKYWEVDVDLRKKMPHAANQEGICLIENLRFHQQEMDNDINFSKQLASLADVYVNDAFACSHNNHASIVGVTEFLPSFAGLLLAKEVKNISSILDGNYKQKIAIIGGKKISSKLPLLKSLVQEMDYIFVVGAMANSLFKLLGMPIGQSFYEDVPEAREVYAEYKDKIILPVDLICENNGKVVMRDVVQISAEDIIYDIGLVSLEKMINILNKSDLVLWNGPIGLYEQQRYAVSSLQIARVVAAATKRKQLLSIVGGGDAVAVINKTGLAHYFSHISTGGGAFLKYLAEKDMVGLKKLKEAANG
jgi:phosphoglycerate kinase